MKTESINGAGAGKAASDLNPFESETITRIGTGKNIIPNIKSLADFDADNAEIEKELYGDGD